MRRPTRLVGLALVGVLFGATGSLALGQDGGSGGRRGRETSEERGPGESAEPDAPSGTDDEVSAESTFTEGEGGTKVKVMEFSGLDISGRLKSPQLLYFLSRLRAEFDRPRLPHRSFIGEMERSTHEKSF
jgi:hypothetical protein